MDIENLNKKKKKPNLTKEEKNSILSYVLNYIILNFHLKILIILIIFN